MRIGFLTPTLLDADGNRITQVREGFARLGWTEGRDYLFVVRSAERQFDRFPRLADELIGEGIDILITAGPATRVARPSSKSVPVVFAFSGDPVDAGFVDSLARAGGNLTGVTFLQLELVGKRVQMLVEIAPRVQRIAVLANALHPGEPSERRLTIDKIRSLGLSEQYFPVRRDADMSGAFAAIGSSDCDALLVFPEALTTFHRRDIAQFAREKRLLSVFGWKHYVEAGGLLAYGPDVDEGYRSLAVFVSKIARGARAEDLPVERPTRIEMTINARWAAELGLQVPPSLLAMADNLLD